MKLLTLVLCAALMLGACSEGDSSGDEGGDASAELACTHFRNVASDADILSNAELREKLREVHDDAQVSEEPGIAESARSMLSSITSNDLKSFESAVGLMSDACANAGF